LFEGSNHDPLHVLAFISLSSIFIFLAFILMYYGVMFDFFFRFLHGIFLFKILTSFESEFQTVFARNMNKSKMQS
jgi:hypothetical protein